jgi:glutathione S-transferase
MEFGGVPVLWHLKVSNYNEKARWALDYKGIPHVRRAVIPGRHRAIARRLTGSSTFPVMVVDGEVIGDSTEIIASLERHRPDPPLYPSEPAERCRALLLEDFFDEEVGPYTRLILLDLMLTEPKLFLGAFLPDMPAAHRLVARAVFGGVRRRVRSDFAIDESAVADAYEKLQVAGERFRAEVGPSGYLVGDEFTVADLTLAALVAPAVAPEQFPYPQPQRGHPLLEPIRAALARSGILEWTREMYGRHRGRSAEIAGN